MLVSELMNSAGAQADHTSSCCPWTFPRTRMDLLFHAIICQNIYQEELGFGRSSTLRRDCEFLLLAERFPHAFLSNTSPVVLYCVLYICSSRCEIWNWEAYRQHPARRSPSSALCLVAVRVRTLGGWSLLQHPSPTQTPLTLQSPDSSTRSLLSSVVSRLPCSFSGYALYGYTKLSSMAPWR
jgi:hypothetical protein